MRRNAIIQFLFESPINAWEVQLTGPYFKLLTDSVLAMTKLLVSSDSSRDLPGPRELRRH